MNSFSVKWLLYALGVKLYTSIIYLVSPFHLKARQWVEGRKNIHRNLQKWREQHPGSLCWIHAASLGEFEMALPLMERMKTERPDYLILLTFFSPSGYEIRKNHPVPDGVFYLPPDTAANARWLVQNLRPALSIFIKYEIWLHYLFALRNAQIPVYLVNAVFRKGQRFFRKNSLFLEGLQTFTHICVQYKDSEDLLREFGISQVSTSGDLRFDRVRKIAGQNEEVPAIAGFKGDSKLLIGGSTWPMEERLLVEALKTLPNWKLALFPHEFKGTRKRELHKIFASHKPVFWSENSEYSGTSRVYIIDTVGLLALSYRYADAAFVGGGFSGKLHNILEPLAFGVPVFTGPKTERFEEAQRFERDGRVHKIRTSADLTELLNNQKGPPGSKVPEMEASVTENVWKELNLTAK